MNTTSLQSEWAWQLGGYFTVASWCLNVWDGFVRFDDEVNYIWPMPHKAYIKWMYFFAKYFALVVQTMALAIQMGQANYPMSLRFCQAYRAIEMTSTTLLMICFDALLVLRIYALYGRRTWSSRIATCAAVLECLATVASVLSTPPPTYDAACVLAPVPKSILGYIGGTFVAQTILLLLAFRKRERIVSGRQSIACITIRDGMFAFVCVVVYLVIVLVYGLNDSPVASLAIYWLPMIFSVSTCRIILNLQIATRVERIVEFTTEISDLDGTLSPMNNVGLELRSP